MKRSWLLGIAAGLLILGGLSAFLIGGSEVGGSITIEGPLRVGMECDYAPYNWQESKSTDSNFPISNKEGCYAEGFDVQIAKLIAQRLGVTIMIQKIAWGDLLPALKDGNIDMIISGMADNKDRSALPDFIHSRNYNAHAAEYCIMVRKDSRYAESSTLADFYLASIQGQKGTRLDAVIDQIYGVKHVPPVDLISEMMKNLDSGAIDGVVINVESIKDYTRIYPSLTAIRFSGSDGFELDFTGVCAWFRKKDTTLMKAVDRAIGDIPVETRQKLIKEMEEKNIDVSE